MLRRITVGQPLALGLKGGISGSGVNTLPAGPPSTPARGLAPTRPSPTVCRVNCKTTKVQVFFSPLRYSLSIFVPRNVHPDVEP